MKKKRSDPGTSDQQEQLPKKISTIPELPKSPTNPSSSSTPAFAFGVPANAQNTTPEAPSNKRRPSTVLHNNHTAKSNCVSGIVLDDTSNISLSYWQDTSSDSEKNLVPFADVTSKMKTTLTQTKTNKSRGLEPLKRELEKIIEETVQSHNKEISSLKLEIEGRKAHCDFLHNLVNNPSFSDIQIIIGKKVLHGHKAILASFIPSFETLITKIDTKDTFSIDSEYDNQQIDSETVELFLHFIYTGTIQVPSNKVTPLLALSNKFQIPRLLDICSNVLVKTVNEVNCLDLLEWSSLYYLESTSWQEIRQATLKFIASNCEKILASSVSNPSAISQLNILSVKDIILSRDLSLETKFEFFMRWALPKYNVYSIFDLLSLALKQHKNTDPEEANCWGAVHLICMNYLALKFEQMSTHSQFALLSVNELKELMVNSGLSVNHEDIVVKSVLRWASFNKGSPLDEIIALIRWPYVSTSTLWACACNPLLVGTKGLSDRLTEAILYQSAPLDKKTSITTCSKRDSYKTQSDVQPQDFAKELLVMFQSVSKKSEQFEAISELATTKDFFVFVPSEKKGDVKETVPENPEFTFGTTNLLASLPVIKEEATVEANDKKL